MEKVIKVLKVSSGGRIKKVRNKREVINEVFYALLQLIPQGKVTTYNSLAKLLCIHPRYVGSLVRSNTKPIIVPCHRVIMSDGSLGGYSLNGRKSVDFKKKLLELERIEIRDDKVVKDYIIDNLVS
ncbi:MAG: MGMT family protein [Sulfolobales archaeon]